MLVCPPSARVGRRRTRLRDRVLKGGVQEYTTAGVQQQMQRERRGEERAERLRVNIREAGGMRNGGKVRRKAPV